MSGVSYEYKITQKYGSAGLSILTSSLEENKKIFDKLIATKDQINAAISYPLLWERMDELKTSRIRVIFEGAGLKDQDQWDGIQEKMSEAMAQIEQAFKKYITTL